jgi:uncharacterized sulfatase
MKFIRLLLALVCALVAARIACAAPPNIVYIISDDQTWSDFGFMGNERVHTPNLDALAAQSARYVNAYVPTSVCRPSLVTLLTGLYPHQHGVHFNHGPPGNSGYNRMNSREEYERVRHREFELIQKVDTLPAILHRELGYRSLQTGKFWEGHWRNGGFTEGMTTFEPPPATQTFGGIRKLANGERVAHGNGDFGLTIGRETMAPITEFIDDCTTKKQPWLVWYAPYLPHQPHDSPEEFYQLARSRPGVEENEIPYYASIAQFDHTVGELIDHVEASGTAANTLFVLVVDNGWSPSERREKNRPVEFAHTKNSKRAPFDDGVRTPILIRWDGEVKPATHNGLVNSIDLVPTLLKAAGAKVPADLPGVDLLPSARGTTDLDPDRPVFGEIYPGDATSLGHPEKDIAYRWVRHGSLKLIVPHGAKPWAGYLKKPALFDVENDPREKVDLASEPNRTKDIQHLGELLNGWWDGR